MYKPLRIVLSYMKRETLPTDWKLVAVGDVLLDTQYGMNCPSLADGTTAIVGMKDIQDGRVLSQNLAKTNVSEHELESYRLRRGDLLLNRTNSLDQVGKVGLVEEDRGDVFASYLVRLSVNTVLIEPEFLNYWLNSDLAQRTIKRIATPAIGQANLNPTEFQKYCLVPLPPKLQRLRITEILHAWDSGIEKAGQLVVVKERRFRALSTVLFERALTSRNDVSQAKEIFEPVSERGRPDLPLLAVMQGVGVVRRDALDRRVTMPEGDGSTYKVARPGDFIISLRSFEGGLEYCDVEGLVSPAYTVLRTKKKIDVKYYRHYFKSRSFVGRLDNLIFGIRDGKQIAFRDFGGMTIPHPSLADQELVSEILSAALRDVELSRSTVRQLRSQRLGLMQKLLTGEWRVPVRDGDVDAMAARVAEEAAQ
jgi:type I restriction enzyme S subunit